MIFYYVINDSKRTQIFTKAEVNRGRVQLSTCGLGIIDGFERWVSPRAMRGSGSIIGCLLVADPKPLRFGLVPDPQRI